MDKSNFYSPLSRFEVRKCIRCNANFKITKIIEQKYCLACKAKNYALLGKYSITLEDYDTLVRLQNNRCYICERPAHLCISKRLVVDHSHKTGKVRALLCNRCNSTLGYVNEDTKILEKLIEYINQDSK